MITLHPFGSLPDGQAVTRYRLEISRAPMRISWIMAASSNLCGCRIVPEPWWTFL